VSPTVIAFLAVFLVVWIASMAWPFEVLLLLRQLRTRHPTFHSEVVAPFSQSWTTMWNPAAINRVLRFVWRRQDTQLADPGLSILLARMRLTLKVVILGWVARLTLLVPILTSRVAA